MIAKNAIGLGYRPIHHRAILEEEHPVEWFEGLADNYLHPGSIAEFKLLEIRDRYPVVLHSVGMSLAAPEPLDKTYMRSLKNLKEKVQPAWLSDHLCWSSFGNAHHHDLLPVPYTVDSVRRIAKKIRRAQDYLETTLCIENLSSYIGYNKEEMGEAEFLASVADEADCHILLDVNNIVVSAKNHNFDADAYIKAIPAQRVRQIHLAGFTDNGTHFIDSHSDHVFPQVWELYEKTMARLGPVPTMIEWDSNIPEFTVLVAEIQKAKQYLDRLSGDKNQEVMRRA